MFTVIFAENKVIQSVKEYSLFFKPFVDSENFIFCQWNTEGRTFDEMAPDFYEKTGNLREWRAIIINSNENLHKKNPFDYVELINPVRESGESTVDYNKRKKDAVVGCYKKSVNNPLTRLTTFLSYKTEEKIKVYNEALYNKEADNVVIDNSNAEFNTYAEEKLAKTECVNSILHNGVLKINLPSEILTVSLRNYSNEKEQLSKDWETHDEAEYSRFAKYNMYHEKVRFLIFDILPESHRQYEFEYIKFLLAVLSLAENDVPSDVLKEGRAYRISCEIDKDALSRLMILYRCKLNSTVKKIKKDIADINSTPKKKLSAKDVEELFMQDVRIDLETDRELREDQLYCYPKQIGLAKDSPRDEDEVWDEQYFGIRKALVKFLKEPRRALKRSSKSFREHSVISEEKAHLLSDFQIEDINEYIQSSEIEMINIATSNIYDTNSYMKRLGEKNKTVKDKIATRMTKKNTAVAIAISVASFLFCMFPMLYSNIEKFSDFSYALIFTAVSMGIVVASGIITLFFLRRGLTKKFDDFNAEMKGISGEVHGGMDKFSDYLTEMCKVMRGNSVINTITETSTKESISVRILNKHLVDISNTISNCEYVFSDVLENVDYDLYKDVEPFAYNFSRITDYDYPLPFDSFKNSKTMYFILDNEVVLPVNYVKSITVQREDWYE